MVLWLETLDAVGERWRHVEFDQVEVRIGRKPSNDLVIPDASVSGAHAKVVAMGDTLTLVDLGSTNGTFVNGRPIAGPTTLSADDSVELGTVRVRLGMLHTPGDAGPRPGHDAARRRNDSLPPPPPLLNEHLRSSSLAPPAPSGPALLLNVDRRPVASLPPEELVPKTDPAGKVVLPASVAHASAEARGGSPRARPPTSLDQLVSEVWAAVRSDVLSDSANVHLRVLDSFDEGVRMLERAGSPLGGWTPEDLTRELLGPSSMDELLDAAARKIVIIGTRRVRIERAGHVSEGPSPFSCPSALVAWIERHCRRPFAGEPTLSGALGPYQLQATDPDSTQFGPIVSLCRRETRPPPTLARLAREGALSQAMANFLETCARGRLDMLVCVGPGADARPLLCALLATTSERELQAVVTHPGTDPSMYHEDTVLLMRDGDSRRIEAALAAGFDRLAIEDLQSNEAPLLAGLWTRSTVSIATLRSTSAHRGLQRFTGWVSGAHAASTKLALPSSVQVVITLAQFSDGDTRITDISELEEQPGGPPRLHQLFALVSGTRKWKATGAGSHCLEALAARGFDTSSVLEPDGPDAGAPEASPVS